MHAPPVPSVSNSDPAHRRRHPPALLASCVALLWLLIGCGFDAQTLQPYTPALGVNINVGTNAQVKVRNLMIITDDGGRGVLSATLYAIRPDALVAVSGTADALDGEGAALQSGFAAPIKVPADGFVILTEQPPVTLTGDALRPGLSAEVTLRFRHAGTATVRVPIMSTTVDYLDDATEFETP